LVPSFFDAHILKHHGYDFATWSLLGSDLKRINGTYVVNGDPLRFIHFSGLDSGTIDKAIGWWLTENNKATFVDLYNEYLALLSHHGQDTLGKLPWSYSTYTDGRAIGKMTRIAYRNSDLWSVFPSPFDADDAQILQAAGGESAVAQSNRPPVAHQAPRSVMERFVQSRRQIGLGPTMLKAIKKITRKGGDA
jgi:hypothetical protein